METFVNKPNGYQPFGPQNDRIISKAEKAPSIEVDKLYYLRNPELTPKRIKSITDYQEWVETGWKQQHGTYEAAGRFVGKLIEESKELQDAHNLFARDTQRLNPELATELLSELGDVLWCATAMASNSSADIDMAMKKRMYAYTMGIIYYDDTERIPSVGNELLDNGFKFKTVNVPWRDQASIIATKFADVELSDIDKLVDDGFEPLPSPAMNIPCSEPFTTVDESIMQVMFDSVTLRGLVEQQFNYGEDSFVMDYDEKAQYIATVVSEIYLNVAFIANKTLGLTLEDVIAKNMSKINARIQAKRIDKTDGARSAELL